MNYFFYLTSDFSKRLREDVVAYVPRLIRPEGRNSIEEGGKEIVGELKEVVQLIKMIVSHQYEYDYDY